MYPPPELRTSNAELLGSVTGMILTAVVAILGLTVLLGAVFLADGLPPGLRLLRRRRGRASGGAPPADVSPGQGDRPWEQAGDRHVPSQGHPHGKPASWVLVATVTTAFAAGGAAIIFHLWWLLWVCTALVLLAIPAGKVIGIMDDTVAWGSTSADGADPPRGGEIDRREEQQAPARPR